MRFGKFWISPMVPMVRFYQFVSQIWYVPFGFYTRPLKITGKTPHPLNPQNLRDIILKNMMFPDNINRAISADKIAARGWVSEKIDKKHLTPLYAILDQPEDLVGKSYPYPYVVKTNNGSGQCCLVRTPADQKKMLEVVKTWDVTEHNPKREWIYRDIKRKFIVEKMLVDVAQPQILDIKVFCFFGEPVLVHHIFDREAGASKIFMTPEWDFVDVWYAEKCHKTPPERPETLDEILNLAKILSDEFDFIRVDFLVCNGKVYFGEMTSFPAAGNILFHPQSFDQYMFEQYQRIRAKKITESRAKFHAEAVAQIIPPHQP